MSEFVVSSTRDPSGYYTVRHADHAVGFVKWDHSERLWRAWCEWARCGELAQSYRQRSAVLMVQEHQLREHR